MPLVNRDTGKILAERIGVIDSFWSRFRGLMFRRKFEGGEALLFQFSEPREFGIHTFFVFFPIDLIYLSSDFEALEVKEGLSPWRTYNPDVKASCLVELPEGKVEDSGVKVGDELELR